MAKPPVRATCDRLNVLPMATLGDATQIEMILSLLCCPRCRGQEGLGIIAVHNRRSFCNKLRRCKHSLRSLTLTVIYKQVFNPNLNLNFLIIFEIGISNNGYDMYCMSVNTALEWRTLRCKAWGRIFSCVRPFYEWVVSNLDRSMHRSVWVLVAHSSIMEGSHMTKNTATVPDNAQNTCQELTFWTSLL